MTLLATMQRMVADLQRLGGGRAWPAVPPGIAQADDETPPRKPGSRERRRDRVVLPPCQECGSDEARVVIRTDYVIYARCSACAFVWSMPKPGKRMGG